MDFILLIAGLAMLIIGAEGIIRGSVSLFRLPVVSARMYLGPKIRRFNMFLSGLPPSVSHPTMVP